MASFAQDLHSLLSMNLKVLAGHLKGDEAKNHAKKLLEHGQSRDLIKLYFESHKLFSEKIENAIDALQQLNKWRIERAHKLVSAEQDNDYGKEQRNLVDGIQKGLRAMLLGFAQAERGSTDVICQRILNYRVD